MLALIRDYASQLGDSWINGLILVLLAFVTVCYLIFALWLTRIDIAEHRLPDKIVLPAYAVLGLPLLAVHWLEGNANLANKAGFSGMFLLGIYWLLRKLTRNSLGFGDVKLAGILGLIMGFFSPLNLLWGTLVTFLSAGLFSLAYLALGTGSLKSHIPFGPFMLLGTAIAFFYPVTTL